MADEIADNVALSPMVYEAFCATPREIFVPVVRYAYDLKAQPIDGSQWISSPLTVAKMTMALEAEGVDKVLEIGCGSGYQAAILSHLAHRVFSIERIASLAASSRTNFETLGLRGIHVRHDDGRVGWSSFAPFERIILSCAAEAVPKRLFDQLALGGILVAPIEDSGIQHIVKFKKLSDTEIASEILDECLFVPLLSGTA